jgi:hypothetical protein
MGRIDFEQRENVKAARTLERWLHQRPEDRPPPPSAERLQRALGRCVRALAEAQITGSAM